MDLTDFKRVNTVIHYDNADKVLQIYGQALQEAIPRFTDSSKKITPYHPHGDEYALLFENITSDEIVEYVRKVEEIAQEKIEALTIELQQQKDDKGKLVFPNLQEINTNLSFGVTDFLPKDTVDTVFLRSHRLLDAVKYFKKGDTIIKNPDSTKGGYIIYSGFTNSDSNMGHKILKTEEEVDKYITLAENKETER